MSIEEQKQTLKQPVICYCNAVIPDDNIDKSNGFNEQGEGYGLVSANCDKCGEYYKISQWGEWDDLEDAKIYLQKYINDTKSLFHIK